MERFMGQTAVITGAGGGIASAIVKELLKRNVNVVGLDKNIEKLKILEKELSTDKQTFKGRFHFRECNISDASQIHETFGWINDNVETFAILVNGAGVSLEKDNGLQEITETDFDGTFGANAKGMIFCAKEALNCMIKKSICGHIVNICSIAGYDKYPHPRPFYAASKHAVRVFSDALRRDICRKRVNIKVTNLSPGLVHTDLTHSRIFKNFSVSREEYLDPCDIARTCISILDTPAHVQLSEIIIEPLFHIDLNKLMAEPKSSE